MESYIVRIYGERKGAMGLAGTVETVGVDQKKGFTNIDELWSILESFRDARRAGRRSPRSPHSQK